MSDLLETLLPAKTRSRLRNLELKPRGLVEGRLAGRYRSPLQGFSVEFGGHRQYLPGDDLRHFDWRVYARSDRKYVRQYQQETNFRVHILVDAGLSMLYPLDQLPPEQLEGRGAVALPGGLDRWPFVDRRGDWTKSKLFYAVQMAAALTFVITQRRDEVGILFYGADRGEPASAESQSYLRPSGSPEQLERLIAHLQGLRPRATARVEPALDRARRLVSRRGMFILISDLCDCTHGDDPKSDPSAPLFRGLAGLRLAHHEFLVFHLLHRDEEDLNLRGPLCFQGYGYDSGRPQVNAPQPSQVAAAYAKRIQEFRAAVESACKRADAAARGAGERSGATYCPLTTDDDLGQRLVEFLHRRQLA